MPWITGSREKTTDAGRGFKTLSNMDESLVFLVLGNAYHRLVPNFLRRTASLNAKLKRGDLKSFEFQKTELAVLQKLKETWTTPHNFAA